METRITIPKQSDRDLLILALVNSGYTVRLIEVKVEGKRTPDKVVEYDRGEE